MQDVFISYSTREREQASALRSYLKENGISCWMAPESIPTGSNYTKEIPVAIRTCRIFLLILSENSQKSPWVLRELDGAVNNGRYILPYLLDDAPMEDEFKFLLTGCQWHPSWQENAMEGLVERIKSLLPPGEEPKQEVTAAPEPEPEVVAAQPKPVMPPPEIPGISQRAVFCPACRSRNTEPLKNDRHSYLARESARFILAWLASIAAFLPLSYVIQLLVENVDFLVKYRHTRIMSTFTDLGYAIIYILSLAASIGVGILCHRAIRKWIRHSRMKQGFRASGMRCRDCCKKFRITTPVMTRFPWEKSVAPVIPLPNIAVVRCPSCATEGVIPRKNGEGSWDRKEKWYFLPAWLAGLVAVFPIVPLVDTMLKWIPFFVGYRNGSYMELSALGVVVAILITLAAAYGVVRLVRLPLREPIRRSRVRKHIRACGFRCPDCGIDFRLVIPLTHKFPHTLSGPAGIRQGKRT